MLFKRSFVLTTVLLGCLKSLGAPEKEGDASSRWTILPGHAKDSSLLHPSLDHNPPSFSDTLTFLFERPRHSTLYEVFKDLNSLWIGGFSADALSEIFTSDSAVDVGLNIGTDDDSPYYSSPSISVLAVFTAVPMFLPEATSVNEALNFYRRTDVSKKVRKHHWYQDRLWDIARAIPAGLLTIKFWRIFHDTAAEANEVGQGGPFQTFLYFPFLAAQFLKSYAIIDRKTMRMVTLRQKYFPKPLLPHDEQRTDIQKRLAQTYRKILVMGPEALLDYVEHIISLRSGSDDETHRRILHYLYHLDEEDAHLPIREPKGHKIAKVIGASMPLLFMPLYWMNAYAAVDPTSPGFDDPLANVYAAPMLVYTTLVTTWATSQVLALLWESWTQNNPNLWNEKIKHQPTSLHGMRTLIRTLSYGFAGFMSLLPAGLAATKVAYVTDIYNDPSMSISEHFALAKLCLVSAAGYAGPAFSHINNGYQRLLDVIAKKCNADPVGRLRDDALREIAKMIDNVGELKDGPTEELSAFLASFEEKEGAPPASPKQPENEETILDEGQSNSSSSSPSRDSAQGSGENLTERLLPEEEGGVAKKSRTTSLKHWLVGTPPSKDLARRIAALSPSEPSMKPSRLTRLQNWLWPKPRVIAGPVKEI